MSNIITIRASPVLERPGYRDNCEDILDADADFKERLIAEVEKQPILYDKRVPDYRNKHSVADAWNQVSRGMGYNQNVLGKGAEHCKLVWKSLKDTFAKTCKRRQGRIDDGRKRKSIWAFYEKMQFLNDCYTPRITNLEEGTSADSQILVYGNDEALNTNDNLVNESGELEDAMILDAMTVTEFPDNTDGSFSRPRNRAEQVPVLIAGQNSESTTCTPGSSNSARSLPTTVQSAYMPPKVPAFSAHAMSSRRTKVPTALMSHNHVRLILPAPASATSSTASFASEDSANSPKIMRETKHTLLDMESKAHEQLLQLHSNAPADECDMFGRYVGSALKALSGAARGRAIAVMQAALLKEQYGISSECSQS